MRNEVLIEKSECPLYDDDKESIDAILNWAPGADVGWSDMFVNPKTKVSTPNPKLAHWTMVWAMGFIGFTSLRDNTRFNERCARAASALFIYLWCQNVPAYIASNCAEAYVNFHSQYWLEDE
jgi:hypothetical protein